MLIRRSGDITWRHATTINVSRTGVLMQTDGLLLEPETRVEVVVALPVYGDLAASRILGSGRIVRTLRSPRGHDPVMAAHLEEYRVLRDEDKGPDSLPTQ